MDQNAGDRLALAPARDTLRRTSTAISLAGPRPRRACFRFSRPPYATKSQLVIQIIRTPPRCLQKSTIPGLPTINPDGPKQRCRREAKVSDTCPTPFLSTTPFLSRTALPPGIDTIKNQFPH